MVELARTVRSGVVELLHEGAAIAVSADGKVLAHWGDPSTQVFYRSAIKPYQAIVSQRNGADLVPEQIALACASHGGHPVQLSMVAALLDEAGLSEADLGCPPEFPDVLEARLRMARQGTTEPRSIFHTCSGKHAAFLRACSASGWPTSSYLDQAHPLQQQVLAMIREVTRERIEPVGVDGCGAPAPAGTIRGLATAFARLSIDPAFADAARAMTQYPSLLSSNLLADARIGAWWGGPVKRGDGGIIAAARHRIGIAVKSREGSGQMAAIGLIAVMRTLGLLADAAVEALAEVAAPVILGGGRPVGVIHSTLEQ